jgi:hypothetical protein
MVISGSKCRPVNSAGRSLRMNRVMDGEKSLGVLRRFESAHLPLPLTGRLMRGFNSIVGEPLHTVSHVAEGSSHGSGVASQFFHSCALPNVASGAIQLKAIFGGQCPSNHSPYFRYTDNTSGLSTSIPRRIYQDDICYCLPLCPGLAHRTRSGSPAESPSENT